ncbi:hypothetical protein SporoP17a_05805 [Sporosarcina ureae]|nr:hypothetical protein SporoP17a_05805 [Sporosarcina ureae]
MAYAGKANRYVAGLVYILAETSCQLQHKHSYNCHYMYLMLANTIIVFIASKTILFKMNIHDFVHKN